MKKEVEFVFVGAAKCGSTWFYDALNDHPDIYVPKAKDIYFFDRYYSKGVEWYESVVGAPEGFHGVVGEVSHDYLYDECAAERIFKYNPDMKIVVCLREPIQRVISAYKFMQRNGTASNGVVANLKANKYLIEQSKYYKYVSMYMRVFGADKVKVVVFDRLANQSDLVVRELYDFLGVDPGHCFSRHEKKSLPASSARILWVSVIAKKLALLVRDLGFPNVVGVIKKSWIKKLLYREIAYKWQDEVADWEVEWMKNEFREDVLKLCEMPELDFSEWKSMYK